MQQSVSNSQEAVFAPETDPEAAAAAAEAAGLRYVTDGMPGITRRRTGKGFSYRDARGRVITERKELARLLDGFELWQAVYRVLAERDSLPAPDPERCLPQ